MDDLERAQAIIERLPSPSTLSIFHKLRAAGWDWEDIEARLDGLVEDIEDSHMSFAGEAERYVRRLLLAAYADEVGGANN